MHRDMDCPFTAALVDVYSGDLRYFAQYILARYRHCPTVAQEVLENDRHTRRKQMEVYRRLGTQAIELLGPELPKSIVSALRVRISAIEDRPSKRRIAILHQLLTWCSEFSASLPDNDFRSSGLTDDEPTSMASPPFLLA